MNFVGRGILLDIEGTTSSVRFVYDVLFPYARRESAAYLAANWNTPAVQQVCDLLAVDAGHASREAWLTNTDTAQQQVLAEVLRQMDADLKTTGLKELQGLVWQAGYASGELRAHVYPDVPPSLLAWNAAGFDVRIYSSGSVAAQLLFFGHTEVGNLLDQFRGHYDTKVGAKRSADSYTTIAADMQLPPSEILFLSDVPAELDAARAAGLKTGLVLRPGNAPVSPEADHPRLESFAEIAAQRTP